MNVEHQLFERWPFLADVLRVEQDPTIIRLLLAVSFGIIDFSNQVVYKPIKGNTIGRVFASYPSLQNAPGWLRRAVYFDEDDHSSRLTDIDMENCFISILSQVCDRFSIHAPYLRDYCNNRKIRQQACIESLGMSEKDAKHLFLIILHGGDARLYQGVDYEVDLINAMNVLPYVKKFYDEQIDIFPFLKEQFPGLWDATKAQLANTPSRNYRGVFISRLCQSYENTILNCMIDFYRCGTSYIVIHPEALMFDGLMLAISERDFIANHMASLEMCEGYIEGKTGFKMKLALKSMTPKPTDRLVGMTFKNVHMGGIDVENCDDEFIRPIPIFWGSTKLFAINAQLNMGKTHAIMDFISRAYAVMKNQRILFITCRRQQARSLQDRTQSLCDHTGKSIPVYYYSDSIQAALREKVGVFIIQYESLHMLGQQFKAFSHVVVDEIRAVLAQVCVEKTNGRNLFVNGLILKAVMQHSKVIFTDADIFIDGCVKSFILSIWDPETVRFFNYTRNSLMRDVEIFDSGSQSAAFYSILYDNITSSLKGDAAPVAIVCRARSSLDVVVKRFDGDPRIMWVSSDSPQAMIENFRRINEYLSEGDIRVLLFTSCVTVGADIQVVFSNIYVIADSFGGATSRDIWQGAGRFRRLDDNGKIHLLLRSQATAPPIVLPSFDVIVKQVELAGAEKTRVLDMYSDLLFDGENDTFTFKLTQPWVKNLLCYRMLETEENNQRWFITTMMRHIIYKRFRISLFIEGKDESDDAQEHKNEIQEIRHSIKMSKELLEVTTLMRIKSEFDDALKIDDRIEALSKDDKLGILSRESFCELLMLRTLSHFPKDLTSLGIDHVRFAMANMSRLYVASVLRAYDASELGRHELMQMMNTSLIEESQLVAQAIKHLDRFFNMLGYGNFDTNSEGEFTVDLTMVSNLWPSAGPYLDLAKSCLSGAVANRKRKLASGKSEVSHVRSAIKSVLKIIGLELVRSPDKRAQMYGIFPSENMEFLVPRVTFRSIDPMRVDIEVVKESVKRLDGAYKKFTELEIDNSRAIGQKKRPVAAIERNARRRH